MTILEKIKEKRISANSYEDQNSYNAAWEHGWVSGALAALSEPQKRYIIVTHYSNENLNEFDITNILPKMYRTLDDAKEAAYAMYCEDKRVSTHPDATGVISAEDVTQFDSQPLYAIGEEVPENFEVYHYFYAVFEMND